MSNSLDLQRLPCGETNFEKMIDGNSGATHEILTINCVNQCS